MKALILVGGYGTRLRPLTIDVPKPVVEFANKAMILHQIEALVAIGVNEVILAINYKPQRMSEYMEKFAKELAITISYSQEPYPLGTAGPLALAADKLNDGEPFFVLNSDVTCDYPLKQLLEFHKVHQAEGTLLVTKVQEPSKYGVVVSDANGRIQRFVEKPREYVGNEINAGIYVFNPSILSRIEPKPTSIEKEIFPQMAAEGKLFCMANTNFWMDIGQPKDFLKGMCLYLDHLKEKKAPLLHHAKGIVGPVIVHETATIGENCVIGPHVTIGPNCVIEDGVRLKNVTLLEGVVVRANSWVRDSIIGWRSTVGRWARIDNVSVLGEDVQIADELFVNGASILPHKAITESIYEPKIVM